MASRSIQHLVKRGAQRELLDERLADRRWRTPWPSSTSATAPAARELRVARAAAENRDVAPRSAALPARRAQGRGHHRRPTSRSCSPTRSASPAAAAWRRRRAARSPRPTRTTSAQRSRSARPRRTAALRTAADIDPQLAPAGEAARRGRDHHARGGGFAAALPRRARHRSGAPGGNRAQGRGARGACAQAPPERRGASRAARAHRGGDSPLDGAS